MSKQHSPSLRAVVPGEEIDSTGHPLRQAIDAALAQVLFPDVAGVLIVTWRRNGEIGLKAVPDVEPLIDGMLTKACEAYYTDD